jgi:uncharacterized membrane protein YkvA (DUF1232 family)
MKSLKAIVHDLRVDTHTIWLCARDRRVPTPARLFGLVIAAYALSPIDLIPDFVPVLGLLDDLILIPLGVWLFLKMVPAAVYEGHRATAEAASHRPVSRAGAVAIILLWLAALVWIGLLLWSARYY